MAEGLPFEIRDIATIRQTHAFFLKFANSPENRKSSLRADFSPIKEQIGKLEFVDSFILICE